MKTKRMLMMTAVAAGMICARADAQNMFVSDYWAHSIYYLTPDGVRNTFATGLAGPEGIAFDKAGNLFVTDNTSGSIYEFTPNGVRSTFASGLSNVRGLAFDQAGNAYAAVAGTGGVGAGSVYKWTPSGQRSTFASGLYAPYALAFDSAGDLFVSNSASGIYNDTILEFKVGGGRTTFATGLFSTTGLAFDSAGNLFVQQSYSGSSIYEFTPSGVRSTFANCYGISLAFDSAGKLLQGDDYGNIYQFSPDGTRTLFASGLARPGFFALQVPEPSVWALLCVGSIVFIGGLRFRHGAVMERLCDPNMRPGADAGWRVMFASQSPQPRAAQAGRSAAGATTITMNMKKLSIITIAVSLLPVVARAQTAASSGESSSWGNLFWGVFPILVLVLIFIPLIRRMQKPIMKRTQQHMERQVQHMERVEQSLDRIIKALERKD
jgi:hypothetical protein